jgi:superfamily II DNA/RNA helicase
LFFSATMPPEITRITEAFLSNAVRIEVARAASTTPMITQGLVASAPGPAKRETLRRLLRSADSFKNAIIFSNRKRDVAILAKSLEKHGFSVGSLHGDMDQRSRMASLEAFRNGEVSLLICSDVAARGLDIPEVSHVFNFDVPTHPEDYVHRIGRTGRAGRSGIALSIVTRADARHIEDIEKLIERKIEWTGTTPDQIAEDEEQTEAPSRARRSRSRSSAATGERPPARSPARAERQERSERGPSRPVDQPRPAPTQADRPVRAARSQPHPRRQDRDDDNEVVIGLGDHVPSFLLRPVKIRSS